MLITESNHYVGQQGIVWAAHKSSDRVEIRGPWLFSRGPIYEELDVNMSPVLCEALHTVLRVRLNKGSPIVECLNGAWRDVLPMLSCWDGSCFHTIFFLERRAGVCSIWRDLNWIPLHVSQQEIRQYIMLNKYTKTVFQHVLIITHYSHDLVVHHFNMSRVNCHVNYFRHYSWIKSLYTSFAVAIARHCGYALTLLLFSSVCFSLSPIKII